MHAGTQPRRRKAARSHTCVRHSVEEQANRNACPHVRTDSFPARYGLVCKWAWPRDTQLLDLRSATLILMPVANVVAYHSHSRVTSKIYAKESSLSVANPWRSGVSSVESQGSTRKKKKKEGHVAGIKRRSLRDVSVDFVSNFLHHFIGGA